MLYWSTASTIERLVCERLNFRIITRKENLNLFSVASGSHVATLDSPARRTFTGAQAATQVPGL